MAEDAINLMQDRFGVLRDERLKRVRRMTTEIVTAIVNKQTATDDDGKKAKAKPKAKPGYSMGQAEVKRQMGCKDTGDKGIAQMKDVNDDIAWACGVLAPLGVRKDMTLVIQPPPRLAMPVLRGLQEASAAEGGEKLVRDALKEPDLGLGKLVNGLRRHANPEVAAISKESCWTRGGSSALRSRAAAKLAPRRTS
ncbi:unnamed protein product [Prorocentrum cordatum]|nr:unnamed protein product [Polarella glacialis]